MSPRAPSLRRYLPSLPILAWARNYDRDTLASDLLAALIVTIMLIPQSLAYALLAGMPPEAGLYASIAPLVLYALFGTSRALAVGPVAVVSLMTAMEERLGLSIDDDEIDGDTFATVGSLTDFVAAKLG